MIIASMKGAILKLSAAAVIVATLGGILVVAARGSRQRALLAYCRNNARELGRAGANEVLFGPGFDRERTGRNFWAEVRILVYRVDSWSGEPDPDDDGPMYCRANPCENSNHRHEWKPLLAKIHPFLCPVYGRTKFNPNDPEAIDYRGPRIVPPKKGRFIIGADRVGNHPEGGGHVIFVDGSIENRRSAIEETPNDSSLWIQAGEVLSD